MDHMDGLTDALVELIRRTSTDLPKDVEDALRKGRSDEKEGSAAAQILDTILQNVALARESSTPLCQDTGTNIWYVHYPAGTSTREILKSIEEATVTATERAYLRPNSVDPVTGKNTGNNLGPGMPSIHFEEWDGPGIKFQLMLKGGGCENVGAQYKLPDTALNAERDLKGVERVVLDAVQKAQGKGCAPGVLGICIGGDRGAGYVESKRQLLRSLDDTNADPALSELENSILQKSNQLGIGPMGFGGNTTLLGVKIGTLNRLPASYYVSISYMCWEYRRREMTFREGEYEIA